MNSSAGPFSHPSRVALVDQYFSDRRIHPSEAWEHVYRLLLWIDRTTGLAHCYESDKAQPGRPWYARSLRFHGWVAEALGQDPSGLASEIDWLFRRGTEKLALSVTRIEKTRADAAQAQRAGFE